MLQILQHKSYKHTQTKSSEHLLCCCGTKHIHYRVHLQAFIVNLAIALCPAWMEGRMRGSGGEGSRVG